MIRKRFVAFLLCAAMLLTVFPMSVAFADDPIKVYLDGSELSFDVPPRMINDRVLVPMRVIFEALGCTVEWEEDTRTVRAQRDGTEIVMQIGNQVFFRGLDKKTMDVPPVETDGRTLVPVRAVSESLDCSVDWVDESQSVIITTSGYTSQSVPTAPSIVQNPNATVMSDTYIGDDFRFAEDNFQLFGDFILGGGNWLLHPEPLSVDSGKAYASAINTVAEALPGVRVFNIVVPTSDEFYAPKSHYQNQLAGFKAVAENLNPNVTAVNAVKPLWEHASEYIYFRTDHHWTQRGSYYAYQAFKTAKGETADPLDSYESETYDNFLGSFATKVAGTSAEEQVRANPDSIESFFPKVESNGTIYSDMAMQNVLYEDVPVVRRNDNTYTSYIGGDNPLTVFRTSSTSGKKLVVLKESYGNAFSTWNVNDYSEVYVIDVRKFNGNDGNNEPMSLSALYSRIGFDDLVIISYPPMMNYGSMRKLISDMK